MENRLFFLWGGDLNTLSGTYSPQKASSAHLTVSSISEVLVTDCDTIPNTKTNYLVPSTPNNLGDTSSIVIDIYPKVISFTSTTPDGTYGAGASINITANFDKALDPNTVPFMNVHLNVNGVVVALDHLSGSSLSGTYIVQDGDYSASKLAASYSDYFSGIQDLFGGGDPNFLEDFGSIENNLNYANNILIDGVAPVSISGGIDGNNITLYYNKALDVSSVPSTGDFTAYINGSPVSISGVSVTVNTIVLHLEAGVVSASDVVYVDYVPGEHLVKDTLGNQSTQSFSEFNIVNNSVILSNATISNEDISLLYSKALDVSSVPSTGDFTAYINGSPVSISSVSITGNTVVLHLANHVSSLDVITLDYAPTSNIIKDQSGVVVSSLSGQDVTNHIGAAISTISSSLVSQTSNFFTNVGSSSSFSNSAGMVSNGNYIYVTLGSIMKIYDISGRNPYLVNSITVGEDAERAVIAGNYLYMAEGTSDQFQIFDITIPVSPVLLSTTSVGGHAEGMDIDRNFLIITNYGLNRVQVYDVVNPMSPSFVGQVSTFSLPAGGVFSNNHYWINSDVTGESSIESIAISDNGTPTLDGQITISGAGGFSNEISGDYLYTLDDNSFNGGDYLKVWNISNPSSPSFVGSVDTGAGNVNNRGVIVLGDYAFVANGAHLLQAYDISTHGNPVLIKRLSLIDNSLNGGAQILSSGNEMYVLNRGLLYHFTTNSTPAFSATITWATDRATDSRINFGPTAYYGDTIYFPSLVTNHSVVLPDLLADTTYHYQVVSTYQFGDISTSDDYTMKINILSNNAAVTSSVYTVSSLTNNAGTITNVPYGTSKATFETAISKGEVNQTWNDSGVANTVVTGNTLVVTAQDGSTTAIYTITVNAAPGGGSGGGGRIFVPPVIDRILTIPALENEIKKLQNLIQQLLNQKENPSGAILTKDLKLGDVDEQAKILQQFLNTHGFVLAKTGVGSLGFETTKFGYATQASLKKFQRLNGIISSGKLGPVTRDLINKIIKSGT